jgi:hypothetical protein
MSTSPPFPSLQTQPRSLTRSFPWARSLPAWPAVPGSCGNSGRRGAAADAVRELRTPSPWSSPTASSNATAGWARYSLTRTVTSNTPAITITGYPRRDTTSHGHTERPELICPELSPWPRRGRGSAMSKRYRWLLPGRQRILARHQTGPYLGKLVGATGFEPVTPSLVRRSFAVAGRRLA